MSKNDYFVIVYRLLKYLYINLKQGKKVHAPLKSEKMNIPKIPDEYFTYIIYHLMLDEYIDIEFTDDDEFIIDTLQITPKGIEYLFTDPKAKAVKEYIKIIDR